MDRTNEYKLTLKWMESNKINSRKGFPDNPKPFHYNDFMKSTRAIFSELAMTCSKLEKLNELARKKTIFDSDESSAQLSELVYIIKKDVNSLNQQIEELRQNQLAKVKDGKRQNVESYSKNVVLNLQEQLASVSSDFKTTLELRSQNMQQQKARREQFTGSTPSTSNQLQQRKTTSTIIDFGDEPLTLSKSNHSQQQQQQSQAQLLIYEDNTSQYLEERASTMQTIESTIVELGGIFNQLATMVQQQDEMISRIDANIADTNLNVEAAHQSLLRYFQSVTNNRWLMFKVFGVLFIFFLLFVMLT
ncbi:syntaxin-5-like [Panonychus citri]|uniref:syntaxin-5-like n=1 Tax=Panonychus citri TaxID=50023 RepID=UPI002307A058|nr:syntaxin-5-like [Panonychus citri]XP_053200773.1 syntaxin-5-like [Panonychus citri]XP_053201461.1 syntaxin-5-like [Panonychus citri]XP_053201462.1 syntaxin-5-like [Panonychus citri]XP_053202459.1 syntaxin-5-like [Panonychus citri]XP_053202460.1 syntaxin-5-like [Panonychus citri]